MSKLAVITAFLGGSKNRYMQYSPERTITEKVELASKVEGLDGLELCYPADFEDARLLKRLLSESGLGVSAVNIRSRGSGKWLRGAFSSARKDERTEVVDFFRRGIDMALEVGTSRISTCPLNDGHDYVFEMNYLDAYRYAEETFSAICEHNRSVRVCIEYKLNDPRTRCLFGSAGETLSFCHSLGAENLGVTLDFGHSLLAGERPAQAVALLHRAGRLFYVHLNDNDRQWDWDLLPGAYHFWELIEFLYYLTLVKCDQDWYAYDVTSKEVDPVEHFNLVVSMTRKLEGLAARIDFGRMAALMTERNPAQAMAYLFASVL